MSKFHILPESERKNPKEVFPNALSIIEYAFNIENIQYFQFQDFNQTPMNRAFNALSFFNELDRRCTREFLQAHCAAVDNLINDTKAIKLTEIVKLNLQLKERLDFLFEPDIAYKLCSVVFFDSTENPHRYEYKKGLEKAAIFRDCPIEDFFLSQPISRFVPPMILSTNDFQTSCEVLTKITKQQLANISTMLSDQQMKTDWYKHLSLVYPQELTSDSLGNSASTNII